MACSFPAGIRADSVEVRQFCQVLEQCQALRRLGSCALNLCYLTAGRLDGYWAESVKPWDVAAGALMVSEAGGQITDMHGSHCKSGNPSSLPPRLRNFMRCCSGFFKNRLSVCFAPVETGISNYSSYSTSRSRLSKWPDHEELSRTSLLSFRRSQYASANQLPIPSLLSTPRAASIARGGKVFSIWQVEIAESSVNSPNVRITIRADARPPRQKDCSPPLLADHPPRSLALAVRAMKTGPLVDRPALEVVRQSKPEPSNRPVNRPSLLAADSSRRRPCRPAHPTRFRVCHQFRAVANHAMPVI